MSVLCYISGYFESGGCMIKKRLLVTLTLGMVGLVAATAETNIDFSGSFEQGYDFIWQGSDYNVESADSSEAELDVSIADSEGVWSVELGTWNSEDGDLFNDDLTLEGKLTVDLNANLAQNGFKPLPFGVELAIGNTDDDTTLSAYNDVTGDGYADFKAIDMTLLGEAIVTSGDDITAKFTASPLDDSRGGTASVLYTPMEGISTSLGFVATTGGHTQVVSFRGDDTFDATLGQGISLAATGNLDKFIDLDGYHATISMFETYTMSRETDDDNLNSFGISVDGGNDLVNGYIQYALLSKSDKNTTLSDESGLLTKNNNSSLIFQVNYNGVEEVPMDVYFKIMNLNDEPADNLVYGMDASYELAGITYSINPEYATHPDNTPGNMDGDSSFTIEGLVSMSF